MTVMLISDDAIPRLESAGWDLTIISTSYALSSDNLLLSALENTVPGIASFDLLAEYMADGKLAGRIPANIKLVGDPPVFPGTLRYDAPTGLGTDGSGVWFSTPNTDTEIVRWYVNSELKIERSQDLATNRSATLAELEAAPGDTVQVCIVTAGGIVGWWGNILLP